MMQYGEQNVVCLEHNPTDCSGNHYVVCKLNIALLSYSYPMV